MAIAQRGSTTSGTGTSTAPAASKPTGVVSGDYIIVTIASSGGGTCTLSGFTNLFSTSAGLSNPKQHVFGRVADGTEGATFTATLGSSVAWSCQCTAYSGVDNTTPWDIAVAGTEYTATVTACTAPNLAAGSANRMLVGGASGNSSTTTFTPPTAPSTWTELYDPGAGKAHTYAHLAQASGAAVSPITFTQSAARAANAWSGALKEASGVTNKNATETSAGADAVTVLAKAGVGDTGAGLDVVLSLVVTLTAAETVAGADVAGTPDQITPKADTDTGQGLEATESLSRAGVGDSSPGADLVASTARSGPVETSAATEAASLLVQITASDVATALEAVTALARTGVGDTAAGDDVVGSLNNGSNPSAADTSTAVEGQSLVAVPPTQTDTGTGTDAASLAAVDNRPETSSATEQATVEATVSRTETVASAEGQALVAVLSGTESSSAAETATLTVVLLVSEVVAAIDAVDQIDGPPQVRDWARLAGDSSISGRDGSTGAGVLSREATVIISGGREARITITRLEG